MNRKGKLLVFEGIDGVGKSTITKTLAQMLADDRRIVKFFAFPGVGEGTIQFLSAYRP